MYTYLFTPYMRTKFQISILIIKNVGPSAPCQGRFRVLGGLAHTYAYHCISFCMNIMHTKFQSSILINKKVLKRGGGPSVFQKGRFAVHMRVNSPVCISFFSIYSYKISALYLDKQKIGAFGLTQGPFHGPGWVNPYKCISLYSNLYEEFVY